MHTLGFVAWEGSCCCHQEKRERGGAVLRGFAWGSSRVARPIWHLKQQCPAGACLSGRLPSKSLIGRNWAVEIPRDTEYEGEMES